MATLRLLVLTFLTVTATAPLALANVVIGVAGPAEGPGAVTTRDISRAVKTEADRLNRNGGVLGERIEVAEADDGCAPSSAEAAARKLIASGATLILGHPCASAAIAAAKVYAQAGTIFMATATRHAAFTNPRAGPTIFRLSGRDDRQGASAGSYLGRTFPGKPIAIVRDQSRYGEQIAQSAATAGKGRRNNSDRDRQRIGGAEGLYRRYCPARRGSRRSGAVCGLPHRRRSASAPDAILGPDGRVHWKRCAGDRRVRHDSRRPGCRGGRAASVRKPANELCGPTRLQRLYQARRQPALSSWLTAPSKLGMRQPNSARSTASPAVALALQSGNFDTLIGMVSFDANGDAAIASYEVVWWKDGTLHRGN